MKRRTTITFQFVDVIPAKLGDGKLYLSIEYATAVHKCCCGCGNEVVTPLTPTDWKVTYDGESVSLSPSIGNWGFACRSHYWIDHNAVRWADQWSDDQIVAGRTQDLREKERHFGEGATLLGKGANAGGIQRPTTRVRKGLVSWLKHWWSGG